MCVKLLTWLLEFLGIWEATESKDSLFKYLVRAVGVLNWRA